jgi:hypothetical protein
MRELGEALALWLYERGVTEDICGASLRKNWIEAGLSDVQIEAPDSPRISGELELARAYSLDAPRDSMVTLPPPPDVPVLSASARRASAAQQAPARRRSLWSGTTRAALLVALGVGAGFWAGRSTRPGSASVSQSRSHQAQPAPQAETVSAPALGRASQPAHDSLAASSTGSASLGVRAAPRSAAPRRRSGNTVSAQSASNRRARPAQSEQTARPELPRAKSDKSGF